jgi:hypothetical protein
VVGNGCRDVHRQRLVGECAVRVLVEEVIYIDDCAVSRSRVGPAGVIAE